MGNIKISFVIAAYNVQQYINKCVDSILSCFDKNIEVIIVNDGSTDSTLDKIAKYKEHPLVKIVNQENKGLSGARNSGAEIACGKYIEFIDGDDFVDENTRQYMMPLIDEDYDVIISNYIYDYGDSVKIADELKKVNQVDNPNRYFVNKLYKATIQRYVIKREILIENGLTFPIGLIHEDVYWGNRVAELIKIKDLKVFYNVDRPWYHYLQNREGSIMNTPKSWKNVYCMLQINVLHLKEGLDKKIMHQSAKMLYGILVGYYNKENPKDKVEEIIKIANANKKAFKNYNPKYMAFYITLKCFGFKFAANLFKPFIAL